jgi:hypothetical protein
MPAIGAHLTTIERKLMQPYSRSRIDYNKLQNKQFQVHGEHGANSAAKLVKKATAGAKSVRLGIKCRSQFPVHMHREGPKSGRTGMQEIWGMRDNRLVGWFIAPTTYHR